MASTRRQFMAVLGAGVLALAGCTGSTDDGEPESTPTPGSDGDGGATVTMMDTTFEPLTLSVATGTTVGWVNEADFGHDVTAAQFHETAADWDISAAVAAGDSTSHTFEAAGVYEYVCTIHGESSMCGAVVVGDASLETSLPCGGGGGPYS